MTALRKGKCVYIRQPKQEELKFVAKLWDDHETMKDIGGPIAFEEDRWSSWYEKMVEPGDGKNFYCLIYNKSHRPVGEVSFHRYDRETGIAELNVKVQHKHWSKGYAREAVMLLLDYYFHEFGGEVITDHVAIDNIRGQSVLLNLGFEHVRSDEKIFLVRMTKGKYNSINTLSC